MPYLTDAASPPAGLAQTETSDQRWAGQHRFAGARRDVPDANLDAARGIVIAILLAMPVWGAVALAVRWLLAS